jgi:hypothetical protein
MDVFMLSLAKSINEKSPNPSTKSRQIHQQKVAKSINEKSPNPSTKSRQTHQ